MKKILSCVFAASFGFLFSNLSIASPAYDNLVLKTDRGTLQLADYKDKVVLLDFWASWCTPCQQSFGWMNTLHERYHAAGLEIIAVNLDKNRALAERFLKKTPAKFAIVYDPEGTLAKIFELEAIPSSFIINQAGEITSKHLGFKETDATSYEETIRNLLTQKQVVQIDP